MEEVIEEALLQVAAVIGVEMCPVLDAMRFEPFLFGCGANEALEIAARMQTLAAPIGRRKERHGDFDQSGERS